MKLNTPILNNHIPLLTQMDQTLQGSYICLGIDTEMQFKAGKSYVWPHQEGYAQERTPNPVWDFHADGYAWELCVRPFTCLEYGARDIGQALWDTYTKLVDSKETEDITLLAPAVFKVPTSVHKSAPDAVKRLGCMPSINVYGDAGTPSILAPSVRTTGCHLHATHPSLKKEEIALAFVRWADVIVGNAWNYVSPEDPKLEALRRMAYGRAGEYRVRTYPSTRTTYEAKGVEYRVLPGTVILNPVYLTLCFNLYRTALRFAVTHGDPAAEITDISREAINKADKSLSETVINWLPMTFSSRQLIDIIKEEPPKPLTPKQWFEASRDHCTQGHRALASKHALLGTVNV